jgi:hypothetical protein
MVTRTRLAVLADACRLLDGLDARGAAGLAAAGRAVLADAGLRAASRWVGCACASGTDRGIQRNPAATLRIGNQFFSERFVTVMPLFAGNLQAVIGAPADNFNAPPVYQRPIR